MLYIFRNLTLRQLSSRRGHVADPLIIKRPDKRSPVVQLAHTAIIAVPCGYLFILFLEGRNLHLSSEPLNVIVHALLIVVAPVVSTVVSHIQPEFMDNGETPLISRTYFAAFRDVWWMLFPLLAAPLLGVIVLDHIAALSMTGAAPLDTSGFVACLTFFIVVVWAKFYGQFALMEQPMRVSDQGLRVGMTRFVEWEKMHHVARLDGRYEVYHVANPELPFSCFRLDKDKAALLDEFMSRHGVVEINRRYPHTSKVKLMVACSGVLIFLAGLALYLAGVFAPLTTVVLTFFAGIFATQMLERVRHIKEIPLLKPVIEPASAKVVPLDPLKVPEGLRDVIPLAEKWGNADAAVRSYNKAQATKEERLQMKSALDGRAPMITGWLESFDKRRPSREANHFKRMLDAYNEMGIWLMPDK